MALTGLIPLQFQSLARCRHLVAPTALVPPPSVRDACSRDARPARCGPARHLPHRGSSPDWPAWTTSGVDWPPCSPAGRPALRSSAGGAHCAHRDGTIHRSAGTCVVFDLSLGVSLRATPSIAEERLQRPGRSPMKKTQKNMPMRKKRRWRRRRKKMEDAPSCTFTPAGRLQFQLGAHTAGSSS